MSGTVRTIAQLLAEFASGQAAGSITPVDEQDFIATMNSLTNGTLAVNIQTANYTFLAADIAQWTLMNLTGTANTLTVPPNSTLALPVGQLLSFGMLGTGVTTLTAGAGVTIHAQSSLILAQYQTGVLYQYATNSWLSSS